MEVLAVGACLALAAATYGTAANAQTFETTLSAADRSGIPDGQERASWIKATGTASATSSGDQHEVALDATGLVRGGDPTGVSGMPRVRPIYLVLFIFLSAVIAAHFLGFGEMLSFQTVSDHRDTLLAHVEARPVLAAMIFFAVYASVVALSLPAATVLSLLGGFLFGRAGRGDS